MDNHIREEKVMTDKRKTQYKQLGLNIAYYRRLKGLTQSDSNQHKFALYDRIISEVIILQEADRDLDLRKEKK